MSSYRVWAQKASCVNNLQNTNADNRQQPRKIRQRSFVHSRQNYRLLSSLFCYQLRRVLVCLYLVCTYAHVYTHISETTFPNCTQFFRMLPTAVARYFSGGAAIRFVLPVLWMTSSLHIMVRNRRCEKNAHSVTQQEATRTWQSDDRISAALIFSKKLLSATCFLKQHLHPGISAAKFRRDILNGCKYYNFFDIN